jgi:hypothetical protein
MSKSVDDVRAFFTPSTASLVEKPYPLELKLWRGDQFADHTSDEFFGTILNSTELDPSIFDTVTFWWQVPDMVKSATPMPADFNLWNEAMILRCHHTRISCEAMTYGEWVETWTSPPTQKFIKALLNELVSQYSGKDYTGKSLSTT